MTAEITAALTAELPWPPEKVWAVVTDLDRWQWRGDLTGLDHRGEEAFTEYGQGGFSTRFAVTDRREPEFWAFDLENSNLTGRWTGVFQRTAAGTQVIFTECVAPKKRWMRLFAGRYLRRQQSRYLADLRRELENRYPL